ncbi:MAG: hemerythrin family protein [Defluviitaleaceae bacterium]|nr:hemerythrin family protein [Defluviitaleaceae bacterium]
MLEIDDSMLTGIIGVDEQHMALVEKVNHLFTLAADKAMEQELKDTFEFLVQYIITHFDTEEKLMKMIGYPNYQEHLQQHQELIEKAMALKVYLDEKQYEYQSILEIRDFLVDWVKNHIKGSDMDIGKYYHKIKKQVL